MSAVKRRLMPYNPCDDTRLLAMHYEPAFLDAKEFEIL
jgi:hypothetical protein